MKNTDLKKHIRSHSIRSSRILAALLVLFGVVLAQIPGGAIANAMGLASVFSDDSQPPSWIDAAKSADDLATDRSYAILAGKLINLGLVNASSCAGQGLTKNGAANPCGEIAAKPAVILWQNQFDQQILESAEKYDVPPYLLKNILAIESQFWPSRKMTIYGYYEYGLGHMTPMGADTLLHWNEPMYKKFCKSVFTEETCEDPYTWLKAEQQAALRGAVLRAVSGDCEHCPGGVNLIQAKASVPIIAVGLRANYENVLWVLEHETGIRAGRYSVADVWKITAATYNAGIGCTTDTVRNVLYNGETVTWKTFAEAMPEGCAPAKDYVEKATYVDTVDPLNLDLAQEDTSKAAIMVFESSDTTPTPTATVEETTATPTPDGTLTPIATITPFDATVTPVDAVSTEETPVVDATTDGSLEATATPEAITEGSETALPLPSETPSEVQTDLPAATATLEAVPPTPDPDFVPTGDTEPVLIKFRAYAPQLVQNIVIDLVNGDVTAEIDELGILVVEVPSGESNQVLKELNSNIFVDYAEPDYIGKMMGLPNPIDPYYLNGHQPNLEALQVNDTTWSISTGNNVVVAILDTGVDTTHNELTGRLWVNNDPIDGVDNDANGLIDDLNGWNYVNGDNSISDTNGHGTHTAGVIAANADDTGIVGIAPESKIMVLKVLNAEGFGRYSDVVSAINYAVNEGAKIIQIGFTGEYNSAALLAATDYAYAQGVTIVAATGNTGTNENYYPAANPNVIGVAALDTDNTTLASFSTYGSTVDFVAPGVGVLSSVPGGYGGWSGTSMSSAEVAGIAALLTQLGADFDTPDEIYGAMKNTATVLGPSSSYGNGIPLANSALAISSGFTLPTPEPSPTAAPMATPPGGLSLPKYEEFWAYNINTDGGVIETQEQRWLDNLAIESSIGATVGNNAIGPSFPDAEEGFDSQWAEITGDLASGGYWLVPEFATAKGSFTSSITQLQKVVLKPRFYFGAGYTDDEFKIQISVDGASTWTTLETFDSTNLPPSSSAADPMVYDVTSTVDTPAKLNALQVRLFASAQNGGLADTVTIYFDQIKIEVTADELPAISIVGPNQNANFAKTDSISFTAKFYDLEDGSTTDGTQVVWTSNIDGRLGTGLSLSGVTNLTPGTHIITVSAKDSAGQSAISAPLTINIISSVGPHGEFTTSTAGCANCHRAHSAQAPNELLAYTASSWESNAFCNSCHGVGGTATTVVTHSNLNYPGKLEGDFELLCIQCHDPHGNTGNLFAVRKYLHAGSLPTNYDLMTRLDTAITFTGLTGTGSFDNTGDATAVCVACHIGLTTNHTGGSGHEGLPVATGTPTPLDYTGQSCVSCHKHTYHIEITVSSTPVVYPNGFMAATPTPTP